MSKVANTAALNSKQSDRGKGIERKNTHYTGKRQYCHKVKGNIVQRGWGWTVWVRLLPPMLAFTYFKVVSIALV